ncbi:hypothetical protein GCM10010191_72310 [Actinomadura vinacea]|uniref:Uncharacterized protein n=2 Tax=Actinomadura vinacea TaxID=115336 RepID=A0ABN3K0F9_9ACTN
MALFLVAGLVFSYGLGHTPPLRVCTAHETSVPAEAADAMAAHPQGLAAAPDLVSFDEPVHLPPLRSSEECLCLAVLLGLLALTLAAKPRRVGVRRPPRAGWALAPPVLPAPLALSRSSLQVLRL